MSLKEYDFDNKKSVTFSDEDISNIFPVVKCTTPRATDATALFEAAQTRLQSGLLFIYVQYLSDVYPFDFYLPHQGTL